LLDKQLPDFAYTNTNQLFSALNIRQEFSKSHPSEREMSRLLWNCRPLLCSWKLWMKQLNVA